MVDLIPYAAELLEPTGADVELSYQNLEARLPLIVLSEISNTTRAAPDGVEILSDIVLQTDIYEFTEQKMRELSAQVSGIMTAAGFRRSGGGASKEDGLCCQRLRFSTTVDEKSLRLYRGVNF